MSYDLTEDPAQIREHLRAALAERDANWTALDALRTRLRRIVPDVVEGGDLVGAVERLLAASRSSPAPRPEVEEIERLARDLGTASYQEGVAEALGGVHHSIGRIAAARCASDTAFSALLSAVRRLRAGPEDATRLRPDPLREARERYDHLAGRVLFWCAATGDGQTPEQAIESHFATDPKRHGEPLTAAELRDVRALASAAAPASAPAPADETPRCACGHGLDEHDGGGPDDPHHPTCEHPRCKCEGWAPSPATETAGERKP
jgi:hypothetical protein